jgi:ADP-heptose:LPS heptosyltransferase
MALVGGASLFVGNDTGPTHIAAALQKRCVAIFGTSDSAAWSPWKTEHRVVENKFPCERCPRGRCAGSRESLCIRTVTVEQVREACDALLAGKAPYDSRPAVPIKNET